jgi:hypothetical protein
VSRKSAGASKVIVSFLSCSTFCAPVHADIVNVGGMVYSIQTLNGSYNSSQSLLESTPWLGVSATANAFADAWYNGGFASREFTYFGYAIAPTVAGSAVQSYVAYSSGVSLYAVASSPRASSSLRYAFVAPLPSKTASLKSSGSKIVVSTDSGVSKNTGTAVGGQLTYLTTTTNTSSSTFVDLLNVFGVLSSLREALGNRGLSSFEVHKEA